MDTLTAISHPCEHPGCDHEGLACYLPLLDREPKPDDEPDNYYCGEHCHGEGFCWRCGEFWSGCEDFDFDERGLCSNCRSEVDAEEDESDEDFDFADVP